MLFQVGDYGDTRLSQEVGYPFHGGTYGLLAAVHLHCTFVVAVTIGIYVTVLVGPSVIYFFAEGL